MQTASAAATAAAATAAAATTAAAAGATSLPSRCCSVVVHFGVCVIALLVLRTNTNNDFRTKS